MNDTNLNISFEELRKVLGITLSVITFMDKIDVYFLDRFNNQELITLYDNLNKRHFWDFNEPTHDPLERKALNRDGMLSEDWLYMDNPIPERIIKLKKLIAYSVSRRGGSLEEWSRLLNYFYNPFWLENYRIQKEKGAIENDYFLERSVLKEV